MITSDELLEECMHVWTGCSTGHPDFGQRYCEREQVFREGCFDDFLKIIEAELRQMPRTRTERAACRQRITDAFATFAKYGMGLDDDHVELLLEGGFSGVANDLGRRARRFDAEVSTADILQACRNAWTATGLQRLMGGNMRLTPSLFAYSMLYPYSDNYMDDPAVTRQDKLGFSGRFRGRLAGEPITAANQREALVWRLIQLIESQYPREEFPAVFQSLLAIHRAQEQSLRLLRSAGSDGVDVVRVAFEKGGTSVLADATLVRGWVTDEEARFAFGWGVVLQLADDLQDVQRDRARGIFTLFSKAAGYKVLDEVTSRTLGFAQTVMRRLGDAAVPGSEILQELIQSSSRSIVIRSAGQASELFSRQYIADLEAYSPFRFGFLRERRAQLEKRSNLFGKLFEAFLAGAEDEPIFPFLPSSLMPRG